MFVFFLQSCVVLPLNAGSSTANSDQQTTVSSETNITADGAVAGPSVPMTPRMQPALLLPDLEAAAKERAMKVKIRSLKSQECKLKAKVRKLDRQKETSKAGIRTQQ